MSTMPLAYIDPGTGWAISSVSGYLIALVLGFFGVAWFFIKLRRRFFIIIGLILISGIIIGVHMNKKEAGFNKKIIILGFDGLSPEIIEPMMERGELPNFSYLKTHGAYSHIDTTNPSQSPVAWTAFAAGKNPGETGIYDFIKRDPKTYGLTLAHSNVDNLKPKKVIKSKCLWDYLSEQKIPSVIINAPLTFPPDKIYGRMLSGMGVPDILGTEGTFTFYTEEALPKDKDIGGNVFQIIKAPVMELNIIGPKLKTIRGKTENIKVPFKTTLPEDKQSIAIDLLKNKFNLKKGAWSDWQEVTFNIGMFRKMKGIFKFYLAEIEPVFKLYITPVNFDPRAPFFDISYPKNYSKELADAIGLYHTQGMPMDTWALNEKRISEKEFLDMVQEVFIEQEKKLDFELNRFKKGLLFSYFEMPDIIQHMFWRYIDTKHPLYEDSLYREIIPMWYKKMDALLGKVIKNIKADDTLIVLSDHGFGTFRRAVHINSWLRKNGYLELKNPDAESGTELLKDIDWEKTKAYAIGFGAIYINQKTREAQGIVNPGNDTDSLKKEIAEKLKSWLDEKYNTPIINNVYFKEDIFRQGNITDYPDLYIGFNIGYRASWQTAIGGVPEDLIEDNLKKWSGDHLFDPVLVPGVLFSNKKLLKENPSLYDITPTILKLTDYKKGRVCECEFEGKPLF